MQLVFEQIRAGGDRNFGYLLGDRSAKRAVLIGAASCGLPPGDGPRSHACISSITAQPNDASRCVLVNPVAEEAFRMWLGLLGWEEVGLDNMAVTASE